MKPLHVRRHSFLFSVVVRDVVLRCAHRQGAIKSWPDPRALTRPGAIANPVIDDTHAAIFTERPRQDSLAMSWGPAGLPCLSDQILLGLSDMEASNLADDLRYVPRACAPGS